MDSPQLPPDFITLTEALHKGDNERYNVIGTVVDFLGLAKSKGTDYTITFTIRDPSWSDGLGLKFRFFHANEKKLPPIKTNGDILILRGVKTNYYQNTPLGAITPYTTWVVIPDSSIRESTSPDGSDLQLIMSGNALYDKAIAPVASELQYIKHMQSQQEPVEFQLPPKPTVLEVEGIMRASGGQPPASTGKWRAIEALEPGRTGAPKFADLFGEVRKMFASSDDRLELSITDYTEHRDLYNYVEDPTEKDGDEFGYLPKRSKWRGPWGRMTIKVMMFDNHAFLARSSVREGMFVLLKNCQIKLDNHGATLEAACRGNPREPHKVNVVVYKPLQATGDDRFLGLLARKKAYEEQAKKQGARFKADLSDSGNKRTHEQIQNNQDTETAEKTKPRKKSKNERRREKKKKKEQDGLNNGGSGGIILDSQSNKYVRCNNIDVPSKTVEDILDVETLKRKTPKGNEFYLPFANCCYKSKVRVVDYYPRRIEDFAVPYQESIYDALPDHESDDEREVDDYMIASNPHLLRWEWRFVLVVEDATTPATTSKKPKQQMVLLVAGGDGDYLLQVEASDLREDEVALAKLRETLFLLWGDLQEKKDEASSQEQKCGVKIQSQPFECLIKEYGVLKRSEDDRDNDGLGYQRTFGLFKTTIVG